MKQLPPSSVFIIFVSDLGLFPAPLYAIIPTMYCENFSRPVKVPLCTWTLSSWPTLLWIIFFGVLSFHAWSWGQQNKTMRAKSVSKWMVHFRGSLSGHFLQFFRHSQKNNERFVTINGFSPHERSSIYQNPESVAKFWNLASSGIINPLTRNQQTKNVLDESRVC